MDGYNLSVSVFLTEALNYVLNYSQNVENIS